MLSLSQVLSPRRIAGFAAIHRWPRPTAAAAVVAIGLALRLGWYLADPCVWWDEAWLILNVLHKSYAELLGPLEHHQAAPPLFLWSVKACVSIFGDGTHALRLIPFLASVAALLLVAAMGGGCPRAAVLPALVLLAGSSKILSHTAEVKPYTLDLCVAAAVALWFCRTASQSVDKRIRVALVLCPAVVLLIYPGCFVAGGVLLGLACQVRLRRELLLLVGAGILTLSAFAVILTGPAAAQQTPALREYWVGLGHFPDWSQPATVPIWVVSGILGIFRYCLFPFGMVFIPLAAIGLAVLWKRGRQDVAIFFAAPLALAFLAGLLGRYPFGGSRLYLFLAPGLAFLVGTGLIPVWARIRAMDWQWKQFVKVALAVLLCWGIVEGATFPLLSSGRIEVRPAVAWIEKTPQSDPVVIGDHVFAYYLRHRANVYLWYQLPDLPENRVWAIASFDKRIPDDISPFLNHDRRQIEQEYSFGVVRVFRLNSSVTP